VKRPTIKRLGREYKLAEQVETFILKKISAVINCNKLVAINKAQQENSNLYFNADVKFMVKINSHA